MNFFLCLRSLLCLSVVLSSPNVRNTEDVEVSFLPTLSASNTHSTEDVEVSLLQPLGNLTNAKEINNTVPKEIIITNHKLVKIEHGNLPREMLQSDARNNEVVGVSLLQTLPLKSEKNDNDRPEEMIIHGDLIEIEHTTLPMEISLNEPGKTGMTFELEKEVPEELVISEEEWSESSFPADTDSYLFDYYSVDGDIVEVMVGEEWPEEDSSDLDAYDTSASYINPPEGYSYDTSGGFTYYTYDEDRSESGDLIDLDAQSMDEAAYTYDSSIVHTHTDRYGYDDSDALVYGEGSKYYYNVTDGNYYNATTGILLNKDTSEYTIHNGYDVSYNSDFSNEYNFDTPVEYNYATRSFDTPDEHNYDASGKFQSILL